MGIFGSPTRTSKNIHYYTARPRVPGARPGTRAKNVTHSGALPHATVPWSTSKQHQSARSQRRNDDDFDIDGISFRQPDQSSSSSSSTRSTNSERKVGRIQFRDLTDNE